MFSLNLGNLVVHLLGDASQFNKMISSAEKTVMGASKKMTSIGTRLSLAVTAPLTLIGAASVKSFASFDDAMTQSTAIMGDVSGSMRKQLEDTARTIAKESITSATELARSYYYLASSGLSAEQSIKMLDTVDKFAVAGMFNMEEATTLLMDAQSALGMKVTDASQNMANAARIADVLTKANIMANASTQQFSAALTNKAAAALRLLNKDVEEGVAVLAAFADQGVKGDAAGEQLSIVLRDLQRATMKNSGAWRKMGMSVYDANGKMLPLADIIAQLEKRFLSMSDKEKKATAEMLGFQDRSFSALQTLLGTSDKIKGYEAALRTAGGVTKEVADKQLASFTSQMKMLWHQIQDVAIDIGQLLVPYIQMLTGAIKRGIEWWKALNPEMKTFVVNAALIAAAIGPGLIMLGKLIGMFGGVLVILKAGVAVVSAFFSIFATGAAAAASPLATVVAVVGAIVAAVAGLIYLIKGKEGLTNAWTAVKDAVADAFSKALGFVMNFSENLQIFIAWLPDNWKNMIIDMAMIFLTFTKNMNQNLWVGLKTAFNLFIAFSGWMRGWWDRLWKTDLTTTILDTLKLWANSTWEWAFAVGKWIKDIFTKSVPDDDVMTKQLEDLTTKLGHEFYKGYSKTNFIDAAGEILKEGADELKGPLEGFTSSIKQGPNFNLEWKNPKMMEDATAGYDKQTEEMVNALQAEMDMIEKIRAMEEAATNATTAPEAVAATAADLSKTTFKEMNLKRFALQGGPSMRGGQKVEDEGVYARLDTLIKQNSQRGDEAAQLG